MTAPVIADFDEVPRPRLNRPARGNERRDAIRQSAGYTRNRTRPQGRRS